MSSPLVVVGDALLDVDVTGRVERTCPDAPALVVDEIDRRPRPGGAAFAAWLAALDGTEVVLVTPLADDEGAATLRTLLDGRVHVIPLGFHGSTAVKCRVRADGHSLLRIDSGAGGEVEPPPAEVDQLLRAARAVLVSDYGRGISTSEPIRQRLAALSHRVPVVWDPHPRGGAPVPGCRIVTPNQTEVARLCQTVAEGLRSTSEQAAQLVNRWRAGAVAVTMGSAGALLSYGQAAPLVVPAPVVDGGTDTCGAGDRFATTVAQLLGRGQVTREAVATAVHSASAFVVGGGASGLTERLARSSDQPRSTRSVEPESVASVIDRVRAAGGSVVATGGCFDLLHVGHVATLRAARQLGDCLVVCVNSDDSVRRLKGASRPLVPAADRVRVLQALECVDAVEIFDENTPQHALQRLRPDIWAKGGDYALGDLPEAVELRRWGGQAVILPYIAGRSTTQLVQSARQGGVST